MSNTAGVARLPNLPAWQAELGVAGSLDLRLKSQPIFSLLFSGGGGPSNSLNQGSVLRFLVCTISHLIVFKQLRGWLTVERIARRNTSKANAGQYVSAFPPSHKIGNSCGLLYLFPLGSITSLATKS